MRVSSKTQLGRRLDEQYEECHDSKNAGECPSQRANAQEAIFIPDPNDGIQWEGRRRISDQQQNSTDKAHEPSLVPAFLSA
jgi:hypothetical protein